MLHGLYKVGTQKAKEEILVLRKSHPLREVPFYVTFKCSQGEQNHRARGFRRRKYLLPQITPNQRVNEINIRENVGD
jgi:hypothetical protein